MDLSTWPNATETAQLLGISERSLYRLAEKGPESKLRQRPGKRPERVYNPDDVEALSVAANRPRVLPPLQESTALSVPDQQFEKALAIFEAITRIAQRSAPQTTRLFLTIPEAAEYSGLSRTYLKRLVREKTIHAIRDRGYKLLRDDLDHFARMAGLAAGLAQPTQFSQFSQNPAIGRIGAIRPNGGC